MSYKVESDFIHEGCRCVVVMTDMGHRCGYVGISREHPLYGVGYSDKSTLLKTDNMPEIPTNEAGIGQLLSAMAGEYQKESISPEMFFSVHGGITYSDGGRYPVESDLWWFGYDCAHCGDGKDLSEVDERIRQIEMMYPTRGIIRTNGYCEQECRNLAEQLKAVSHV